MEIVFAILGFVVGAIIGMAAFALVVGERRVNYRVLAARHPWIRLVLILWTSRAAQSWHSSPTRWPSEKESRAG
jgi:hypothetical protein